MALAEPAEHVEVVGEPQLGMQPAHDVELAGRVVARRVRFGEDLVEAAGVGTIFPRHARERAEHAGVAQHANVRRVEMLVRREEHAVAVAAAVREVAEPADGEEVVGLEQGQPVVARQPLAALDLLGDGLESRIPHAARRTASVALCPPNPKEFESAISTARLTALLRSEEHTSELQSLAYLVCRLLLEKKKKRNSTCTR